MQLENTFVLPISPAAAWPVLLDLERVAPCFPGAVLETSDVDSFSGRVKVKLGAVQMAYRGEGKFTELDETGRRMVLDVRAAETRGSGTASATVTIALGEGDGGTTKVRIMTDLAVTGRAAQFGRGILAEVSAKIISQFADNLAAQFANPETAESAAPVVESDPIDLGSVAVLPMLQRAAVPAAAILLVGVVVAVVVRGNGRRSRGSGRLVSRD